MAGMGSRGAPSTHARPVGLARLLEILHEAPENLVTLHAEYRDWRRPKPTLTLGIGSVTTGRQGAARALCWTGGGPFPRAIETRRTLWLAADRLRVEIASQGQILQSGIQRGTEWWHWSRRTGATTGNVASGDRGVTLPPLLDPPLLTPMRSVAWLRLRDVRSRQRAGRQVITASASLRKRAPAQLQSLHYELEFDARYGTTLRFAAYDGSECVLLTEVIAIAFGCDVDPRLFLWPSAGTDGDESFTVPLPADRLYPEALARVEADVDQIVDTQSSGIDRDDW